MTDREQAREREDAMIFSALSFGGGLLWGLVFLAMAVGHAPLAAWIGNGVLCVMTWVGVAVMIGSA